MHDVGMAGMSGKLYALASNLPIHWGIFHANSAGINHANSAMQLSCHYVNWSCLEPPPIKGGWGAARPGAQCHQDSHHNYCNQTLCCAPPSWGLQLYRQSIFESSVTA